MTQIPTLGALLNEGQSRLKNAKIETPRLDAELLLAELLKTSRELLIIKSQELASTEIVTAFRNWIDRRAQGEPVAYLVGHRGFYGLDFMVTPDVLIPRPETEAIVDLILEQRPNARTIIDLGCGSGCIGLSLLASMPEAKLLAVDLSEKALAVAKENAKNLGLIERCQWLCADAGQLDQILASDSPFKTSVDIIVANPPYIAEGDSEVQESVRKYEPSLALFSGEEGLNCIREWLPVASRLLSVEGLFAFEIGYNQRDSVVKLALEHFVSVNAQKDFAGHDRIVVCAHRSSHSGGM